MGEFVPIMGMMIPIVAILVGLVGILSTNWRKAKEAEYRAIMVQNMLDKNFTSDEIERVMGQIDCAKPPHLSKTS
jgi:hypothetical protein